MGKTNADRHAFEVQLAKMRDQAEKDVANSIDVLEAADPRTRAAEEDVRAAQSKVPPGRPVAAAYRAAPLSTMRGKLVGAHL